MIRREHTTTVDTPLLIRIARKLASTINLPLVIQDQETMHQLYPEERIYERSEYWEYLMYTHQCTE